MAVSYTHLDVYKRQGQAIVTPGWMKYVLAHEPERYQKKFAQFAKNVFGVDVPNEDLAAKLGITCLTEWLDRIGAPTSFKKGNIPTDKLDELVEHAYGMMLGNPSTDYNKEQIRGMFECCLD